MAETITVRLTGFQELQEKLRDIPDDMRKKLGFQAVARVALTTKRDATANILALGLVDTGALSRGVAVVRSKTGSQDVFAYEVGIRAGGHSPLSKKQKGAGDDPWYWFLHEFGFTDRGGGQVGPTPFLTPAFQARMGDAPALMGDTLWKGILKYTGSTPT